MSHIRAPNATAEVSTAWLDSVISKKRPGVRVIDSKIDEVILGNSGKVRVSLTYNDVGERLQLPPRVIVKGGYNRFGPDLEFVYFTEMRFYRDILPLLDINAPLCLYADQDVSNEQSLVILEDLSLRDITWCHASRPLGYQEAADFLTAMASFNARWWQSPTLLPGGELGWIGETLDGWTGQYLQAYIQPEMWRKYTALERGAALPRALHDRNRIEKALNALKRIHKAAEFCLVHGDEHLGNLYIEPNGRPGFLDWQVKRAPWSQGVSYFMVGGLDSADRRHWERGLLAHYLDCLEMNGVDAPSFEKAWLSYRRDILYGFLVWVINDSKYQSETVNVANTVRFGTAMLDHDTLGLLL